MYNNNFREVTTQDLINLLTSHGYECKETSNEYISICPNCKKEKPTLHISKDKPIFNCFTSGQCLKGNIYKLREVLGIRNSCENNYQEIKRETTSTSSNSKPRKEIKISVDDLRLIETFPLNDIDKKRFKKKRAFEANKLSKNYISLTGDLIEAVKKTNEALGKQLDFISKYEYEKTDKKTKIKSLVKKNKYDLIILYRDTNGTPISIRFYSFNPIVNPKAKKITITGQSVMLYGLEHFSQETKKIVFVEGEEKAEAFNIYRKDKTIVAFSISGIGIHTPAINFLKDNPKLEYFVLFDNDNRALEKREAYKLACGLNAHADNKVMILELPTITGKNDLDSYLANISEENKTQALENILNNPYTISDYQELHSSDIIQKEFELQKRVKFLWKALKKEVETIEKLTIEQIKEEKPELYSNFIETQKEQNTSDILLDSSPCGSGKTYAATKQIETSNIIISTTTRGLRDEIAKNAQIETNIGLIEHCENTLNSSKLSKEEKDNTLKTAKSLSEKGYSIKQHFCKSCKLVNDCKLKSPNTASIVETHAKTFTNQKISKKTDVIFLDESITNLMFGTKQIDLGEIKRILEFYDDITLQLLVKGIEKLLNTVKNECSGTKLKREVKKIFKNEIPTLDTLLSILDLKIIDKHKTINKNDYDKLPDKNSLKALIFAFNSGFLTANLKYNGFDSYLVIDYKKDLELNKPIINSDATGSKELLEALFPNKKIINYKPFFDFLGINYKAIYHKTFSASNLLPEGIPPEETEIYKLIKKLSTGKKTLVVCSKSTKEILEPLLESEMLFFEHYQSEGSIGSNKHKDCELVIALPPAVELKAIIRKGKVFFGSVNTELIYKSIATGSIENNKELYVELKHFRDKNLNLLLNEAREALIYQALFRVKRDTDIKEFITLGNIPLKQYGLIPNQVLNISDVLPKKEAPKTHQELRAFIKFFLSEILEKQQFILLSDIYALHNLIKDKNAETLINSRFLQLFNNIYSIFLAESRNSTNIMVSVNSLQKKTFDIYVREEIEMLQKELGFIETKFPLLNNPAGKILLKNDSALELAKDFYKDSLFIKSPAPAPKENIIIENIPTGDKLEADKKEIETTMSYDHIEKLEADIQELSTNVNKLNILEIEKIPQIENIDLMKLFKKEKKANISYLDNTINFGSLLTFLDNEPSLRGQFISSSYNTLSNQYYINDCLFDNEIYLNSYKPFLTKKFIESLDSDTIKNHGVREVTAYNSIELLLKNKNSIDYNQYIKNNKKELTNDLNKYLVRLVLQGQKKGNSYLVDLRKWLYIAVDKREIHFKRTFFYEYIKSNLDKINCQIEAFRKLSFDDIKICIDDFLAETIDTSFDKIEKTLVV